MVGRWLAVALAIFLAGCSGDASPADGAEVDDADAGSGFGEVATTASTGGITGVVVDEAVRPIVDARVTLVQADREAVSDSQGEFILEALEPGAFTLTVDAVGYLGITQTVDVVAGTATKVKVVLLQAVAGTDAYHTTYAFRGLIDASVGAASWAVEYALDPGGDALCSCTFFFTTDEHPVDFVIEAVWEETVADDPFGLGYYWDFSTAENGNLSNGFSYSPLYVVALGDEFPAGTVDYKVRLTGPWTWVSASQAYDLYVTVFYRANAPQGWSLVNGDT